MLFVNVNDFVNPHDFAMLIKSMLLDTSQQLTQSYPGFYETGANLR